MSRFVISVVALFVVLGGCSGTDPTPGSETSGTSIGDQVRETTSTTEASESRQASDVATVAGSDAAVTTTSLVEERYQPFVEAWNNVHETGSAALIGQALNPESLNLYGEEACVEYIASQDAIPETFSVALPIAPAQGLTQVDLDGFLVAVYLSAPVVLDWPGGEFAAQWAPDWVGGPAYGQGSVYRDLVLVDCGEPLAGRMPLLLASYVSNEDLKASSEVTLSVDAPNRWWIDIQAHVGNPLCNVAIVDAASGDTLVSYTAYEDTAAEVTLGGSLEIVASANCPRIRAVTDQSLLRTPVSDLEANPASIWIPHIYTDGEAGAGDTMVIVNSGELPADLTGWSLEGDSFSLQFPDGLTIDPKQQIFVHARCGTDTDTELYLCLEDDIFASHTMTLYNQDGSVIDGFS